MEIKQTDTSGSIADTQKENFPVGMIIILVLLGFGFVGTLSGFMKPMLQFGPFILIGAPAMLYFFIVLGVLGLSFYGILKRKIWARNLIIGWYILGFGIMVLNFLSFLADKQKIVTFYQQVSPANAALFTEQVVMSTLLFSLIGGGIVGLSIIFYVYRKRDFFKN